MRNQFHAVMAVTLGRDNMTTVGRKDGVKGRKSSPRYPGNARSSTKAPEPSEAAQAAVTNDGKAAATQMLHSSAENVPATLFGSADFPDPLVSSEARVHQFGNQRSETPSHVYKHTCDS